MNAQFNSDGGTDQWLFPDIGLMVTRRGDMLAFKKVQREPANAKEGVVRVFDDDKANQLLSLYHGHMQALQILEKPTSSASASDTAERVATALSAISWSGSGGRHARG